MNYGFVIDNRKCIGCHACTVACKAEHDVPVGVNRTWVKYIEKGEYPNTRRLFSVMRCNHCADAPCVDICPTKALFTRDDGIVDFDSRRCIGCKACMQACPYDALYIDPDSHTAAKCNYCAHRVDIGLEPACVIVCPEHAIVSGDLENPASEIAQLVAREQVTARKVEKGTRPNLFYIEGDEISLNPTLAEPSSQYMWSSQTGGVGHFARYAESRTRTTRAGDSVLVPDREEPPGMKRKARDVLTETSRRVYDVPGKGVLWGWPVTAYIWTKAAATGAFLVMFLAVVLGGVPVTEATWSWTLWTALIFLGLTGWLLVKDLDQPRRFLYVLLRPNWSSWLVRGGYAIAIYGFCLTCLVVLDAMGWDVMGRVVLWAGALAAVVGAVYTAFLFAQAKGRDLWQSPLSAVHMLTQSLVAGAAVALIVTLWVPPTDAWLGFLRLVLQFAIGLNLIVVLLELVAHHATDDAARASRMITAGEYRLLFWAGIVTFGHVLPLGCLLIPAPALWPVAGALVLAGAYATDHVWVQAPQRVPLS